MLLHFDDATSLTGARLFRRDKLILLYGLHHTLELQCIAGPDNIPIDMQSLNCTRWELTITPSLASPSLILAQASYSDNIAVGDTLSFDFSTATVEMYRYVSGQATAPGVFQLLGYEGGEDTPTVGIQFPLILRTTAVDPIPPDLSTAIMNEIQRQADEVFAGTAEAQRILDEVDATAVLVDEDARAAAQSASDADGSARDASNAAQDASGSATLSESYARGGTGTRTGEDTDNSKYYKEQAAAAMQGAETAQSKAEQAQTKSEQAQDKAEQAQGKAETAQTKAEQAQGKAETAEGNASTWAEGTDQQVQQLGGEHSAKGWADIATGYGLTGVNVNGSPAAVSDHVAEVSVPTQLSQLSSDATHRTVTDTEKQAWNSKSDFSGSYNDLTDKPTIPTVGDGTITIKQGDTVKGTFTTNQSGDTTITLDEGGGTGRAEWGHITGTLSNQTDLNSALSAKQDVIDASHKIPYTYISDTPTIPSTAADVGAVPTTRTVNSKALSADITLTAGDVGAIASTEKGAANGVAELNANGKVPSGELPVAGTNRGAIRITGNGLKLYNSDELRIEAATFATITNRSTNTYPIVPNNLNYAVTAALTDANHITLTTAQQETAQQVLGLTGITEIPAATSAYTLAEGVFRHAPESASTYTLPAVTDSARTHVIQITIDFTTVQTCAFVDSNGDAITMQYTPTIAANDVYTFRCEYSAVQGKWLIYPEREGGSTTNDFVLKSMVGVANGVAGLDANGKVPPAQLPTASTSVKGAVKIYEPYGIKAVAENLILNTASAAQIAERSTYYYAIGTRNLNYAVTAALTDANHITLNAAQQETAQQVLGLTGITEIPAATSAYTLYDGRFSHVPSSASTYTLPAVTDATIQHEIVLSVRFSASVLTYSFEDSEGNALAPLSTPTIADGTVVEFLCRYEALLGQWVVMPVVVGTYVEPVEE